MNSAVFHHSEAKSSGNSRVNFTSPSSESFAALGENLDSSAPTVSGLDYLTVPRGPHDALRLGLEGEEVASLTRHGRVAENGLEERTSREHARLLSIRQQYGLGEAMRRRAEMTRMEDFHRLPGLSSSFVGRSLVTGSLASVDYVDWLGDKEDSIRMQVDAFTTLDSRMR